MTSRTSRSKMLASALSVALAALATTEPSGAQGKSGGCMTIEPATAFDGTGYQHYAAVTNGCSAAVRCLLWTDVDPPPLAVEVDAGQKSEVTFRRGSPTYEFRAFARCQFR